MPGTSLDRMPKQVSALNTFWLIEYLRQHHPEISPHEIIDKINEKSPYYVENLKTGVIERVSVDHLVDTEYWFSNPFMIEVYRAIQERVPDPNIAYKMGRTSYKAQHILKTAIAVPLMGPRKIFQQIVKENSKYNRTKDNMILRNDKGHSILRLIHHDGIVINDFAMQWHRGVYEAYALLAGATDIRIDVICVEEGPVEYGGEGNAIYDFDLRYREASFFNRVLRILLFNLPVVKEAIEKADQIQMDHQEQILNRDRIIDLRTKELKDTQARLVESEKRSLEHRITGGFAHEMRNALAGAQLEFKTILNYKEQGYPATEAIKQAATRLFETIETLHREHSIPREKIATGIVPHIKDVLEVLGEVSSTMEGVHHDLERALSITNQIRDYARMSELKPGDDPVDLMALLRGYGDRYAGDFETHNIRYVVEGVESLMVRGDETHMNSIFSNLINNARDALVEEGSANAEIKVDVDFQDQDGLRKIVVRVRDNGPGIPEGHLPDIFEPFFSTKPASGTGLGLSILMRLVRLYNGRIDVRSKENQGTTFTIFLPDSAEGETEGTGPESS
jgi:signal transduction histidine kinase